MLLLEFCTEYVDDRVKYKAVPTYFIEGSRNIKFIAKKCTNYYEFFIIRKIYLRIIIRMPKVLKLIDLYYHQIKKI